MNHNKILKKKIIYLILSLTLCVNCFSQEIPEKKDTLITKNGYEFIKPKTALENDTIFNSPNEIEPRFLNCDHFTHKEHRSKCFSEIFYETIQNNIRLKKSWFHTEIIKFDVVFIINKLGEIEGISFVESNDENHKFENEILRVLKKMPKILPGIKNGKAVKVRCKFPVRFNLPK